MYSNEFRAGAVAHTTGPLTIREAAAAFEVSPAALWRWRKKAGLVKARKAA
jgi:transposase-like protein